MDSAVLEVAISVLVDLSLLVAVVVGSDLGLEEILDPEDHNTQEEGVRTD